jgi:cell division cycle protein 20 (cofactor of APC complex)
VTTSSRTHSLVTPSQVTSLVFNPHGKELLSSHGFPNNQLSIWSYPTLAKVVDVPQAHETRVLHSALSPDGCTVATASSDENLKFWRVFERKKGAKAGGASSKDSEDSAGRRSKTGIAIR